MKPTAARRLLGAATGLAGRPLDDLVADVLLMAAYKYDGYDGYRPGQQFVESFAQWLLQFQPDERMVAVDFVRRHLVFISRRERHHLVELVYPTVIRPNVLRRTSQLVGLPAYRTAALTASREFAALQRATLMVGLSDGADLGLLRRVSPQLRDEQFLPAPDLSSDGVVALVASLREHLAELHLPAIDRVQSVVLVDDFTATGTTLLRFEDGRWDGRLCIAQRHLAALLEQDALAPDPEVHVVLYVATDFAERRLGELLAACGLPWTIDAIQRIGDDSRVTPQRHPAMLALCTRYADGTSVNYIPKDRGPLAFGCGGAALGVVLHHNTPDNSIALLWQGRGADRSDRPIIPLFPRLERHP